MITTDATEKIWVIAEVEKGTVTTDSLEILSELKEFTVEHGQEVVLFVDGNINEQSKHVLEGFDYKICLLKQDKFPQIRYIPEAVSQYLADEFLVNRPVLVLAPETNFCNEVLARSASILNQPFVPNCICFPLIGWDYIKCIKLLYKSRVEGTFCIKSVFTPFATIKTGIFNVREFEKKSDTTTYIVDISAYVRSENFKYMKGNPLLMDITEADIIIAGGRGLGLKKNFDILWELAGLMGASVGGTRMARDEGWISADRQIGQTGKTVAPKLLMSCGISGALQHILGMRDARTIIVINRDKNAPIHKLADVSIIGDVTEIIPELVKLIKEDLNKKGIEKNNEKIEKRKKDSV
jgi:electron transfer flavoprotein alpha subunit